MLVTIDELKHSLRIETDEDDAMLEGFLLASQDLVLSILRLKEEEEVEKVENAKAAILYAAGYLYENRTEANHNRLNLSLRALLLPERSDAF